jgi:uncharacterized protein Ymh
MLIKDTDPKSEQALINASKHKSYLALFRGAFGAFKNPLSHRSVGHDDPVRVFELLAFASLLMRLIDDLGAYEPQSRRR